MPNKPTSNGRNRLANVVIVALITVVGSIVVAIINNNATIRAAEIGAGSKATATTSIVTTSMSSPTITITPEVKEIIPVIPQGYEVCDHFDNQDFQARWQTYNKEGWDCNSSSASGLLDMQCNGKEKVSIWLEYFPADIIADRLLKSETFGVAMSTKLINPVQDNQAKVYFVIHLNGPDGQVSERVYFFTLRYNNLKITEAYPNDPKDPWVGYDLLDTPISIDGTKFHSLRVEYTSGLVQFFVDDIPILLNTQPNISEGFKVKTFLYGVGIDPYEAKQTRVEAIIDWIAIKTDFPNVCAVTTNTP